MTRMGWGFPTLQSYRSLLSMPQLYQMNIVDAWMMKTVVTTKWSKIYSLISVYNPVRTLPR